MVILLLSDPSPQPKPALSLTSEVGGMSAWPTEKWQHSGGGILDPQEAFEEAMGGKLLLGTDMAGRYTDPKAEAAYDAWEAALEYAEEKRKEDARALADALSRAIDFYSVASTDRAHDSIWRERWENKKQGVAEALAVVRRHLGVD